MPATGEPAEPYKVARFEVFIDGFKSVKVSRVKGLRWKTAVVVVREGADVRNGRATPGLTRYSPIVLERARTDDMTFQEWADIALGKSGQEKDLRRGMGITLLTGDGKPGLSFNVFGCWPSKYVPFAYLNADCDSVVVERLVLEHQGWDSRNKNAPVPEPAPEPQPQ